MTAPDMQAILRSMARSSIRLTIGGRADTVVGASRFGGMPDVPADFTWPVFETATYDDDAVTARPLAFLAQFHCEALAPYDTDGLLPKTGVLSFFYELGSQRWGYDPADRGCARVFWFPEGAALSPVPFPAELPDEYRLPALGITLEPEVTYPAAEDFYASRADRDGDWEPYWEARAALDIEDPPDGRSRLLGWPDVIQNSFFRECELTDRGHYLGGGPVDLSPEDAQAELDATENWQLLFQLGTVTGEDFELMFGDCGRVYFCIRREDLTARRFDRVWLILQCG